jgi:hypothetical protein
MSVALAFLAAACAAAVWSPAQLNDLLERAGVAAYVVTALVMACAVVACAGETRTLREVPSGSPERLVDRPEGRLAFAAVVVAFGLLGGPKLLLRSREPGFSFNHGELRGRTPYRRLCVEDHAASPVTATCWAHPEAALAGEMKIERWKTPALPPLQPGAWADAGPVDAAGRSFAVRVRAAGSRFPHRDLVVDVEQPYVSYRFESTIGWKEGTPPASFQDMELDEHKRLLTKFFSGLRWR